MPVLVRSRGWEAGVDQAGKSNGEDTVIVRAALIPKAISAFSPPKKILWFLLLTTCVPPFRGKVSHLISPVGTISWPIAVSVHPLPLPLGCVVSWI